MTSKASTKSKDAARNLNDFRAAHDKNVIVPNKINAALADMLKEGPENWSYEADFIRRAGISQTDMGLFRDQFEEYIVQAGDSRQAKRVWFADKKVAAKVRLI